MHTTHGKTFFSKLLKCSGMTTAKEMRCWNKRLQQILNKMIRPRLICAVSWHQNFSFDSQVYCNRPRCKQHFKLHEPQLMGRPLLNSKQTPFTKGIILLIYANRQTIVNFSMMLIPMWKITHFCSMKMSSSNRHSSISITVTIQQNQIMLPF